MNDKLQQRIQQAEDEQAGEIMDSQREAARMQAMFVLGGINVVNKVAVALNSEAIKALSRFQEQKMHEELGHPTFVDFLERSEYSPMTKTQFYHRKELLEREGDALFDLMTELGMSIRKRKLLGKGNIEMSGELLIVRDGEEVTEIPINDRAAIFDAITALADANAEKSIKLERQQDKIDKHGDQISKKDAEIDQIKAAKIAEFSADAHMTGRVELGLAFDKFTGVVTNLAPMVKEQFRDAVLEDVARWSTKLRRSYRTDGTERPVEPVIEGESFGDAVDKFLDNIDLDVVADNDDELAQQL